MFKIQTQSATLGYSGNITFCYKLPNGLIRIIGDVEKEREVVATGIQFEGKFYNLPGYHDFDDADTVYIYECDPGEVINDYAKQLRQAQADNADLDAMTVDQELRITMLELGL